MRIPVKRYAAAAIVAMGISIAPGALRTTPEAQQKIAAWEECRATPYRDGVGVMTVGCGSTSKVQHRSYSAKEVATRFITDMQHAENCIRQNFKGDAMPQSAFEAMTDAAFNLGCINLMWYRDKQGRRHRTTIWHHAQAQQWPAMCNRLTDFVNSGGKLSQGLLNRRTDFKAWCLRDLSGAS